MNVKNYNFTEIFSQDFAEKLLFLRCFWKLKICGAGCCLYHLPAKLKSISIWPLFRSNVCIKFARWVNSSYTNKDHGLSESKLVKISLLLHRPFDLYINWPIKTFFFFVLSLLAGCWDTDQCSSLSAPDQRAVEPSAPADAAAPEDQWLAEGHWNHLTDQSLLLILHQHVSLLHTRHGQVRKIVHFLS